MYRLFGAFLMSLLPIDGSTQAQEITVDLRVPGYTKADAEVAIELLRRNCRPLGDAFWADVTGIKVEVYKEFAPHRLSRGWANTMTVMLTYSRDPQYGPSYASGAGVLAGHTLHFDLGGGETPGMLIAKRSTQYLCGLAFDQRGNDVFVDVPGMKFLDR